MNNGSAKQKSFYLKNCRSIFICAIAVPVWRPPAHHLNYQIFAMDNQVKTSLKNHVIIVLAFADVFVFIFLPNRRATNALTLFTSTKYVLLYFFNTCMTSQYQCWKRKKISSRARECLTVRTIQILALASRMKMTHTVESLKFVLT